MSIIAKASTVGNNIKTIDFNGQPLLTIELDGIHYTAVKPICENIGLNWDAQRKRINRDDVLVEGAVIMTAPSKGGNQDMLCLPIDMLNGWLFGVDTKRVKSEIKNALIQYKKECYTVLHDYWHTGSAIHPSMNEELPSSVKDRNGLVKAAKITQYKLGIGYDDVFSLIHHRFNIDKLGDLTVSQVGEATEYIQRMRYPQLAEVHHDSKPALEIEPPYHYRNNERLVSKPDAAGNLWTRPLADHEFIASTRSLPQFINDCEDFDLQELTAISFSVSKKMVEAQAWSNVIMVNSDGEQS